MADRVIRQSTVSRIWEASKKEKQKAIDWLNTERGISELPEDLEVGYITYLKINSSFFLKEVVVFPLFGADGKIKGLNTRKVIESFFLRIVSSGYPLIYSDYEFYNKTLVLAESPIDAISLMDYLPDMSVGATLSASMTQQQLTLLSVAKKIIVVTDNDSAGRRAASHINSVNDNTYIVPTYLYEDQKDINELLTYDKESFLDLVKYIQLIDSKT